ncbi:MAG: hypothetical protein NT105_23810 [Verrucomicrobia bacterium]|nr:hypothetical protein [Verrucomicrobiota bacterium]
MQHCAGANSSPAPDRRSETAATGGSRPPGAIVSSDAAAAVPTPQSLDNAWKQRRASLVREWRALQKPGENGQPPMASSAAEAARILGKPHCTLLRYARLLDAGGEEKLGRQYKNCGRKKKVNLNDAEKKLARTFVLKTESVPMGIELMADSPVCRPEVREALAANRLTGRYPQSIMRDVRVTQEEMAAARSRDALRSIVFSVRRGFYGYDDHGAWVPVNSGDIIEFDDVSTDVPFFWMDPDGYWRVGRQILMARDVRSGKWLGVYPIARFADSYRAEDIARFKELLTRRWGRFGRFRDERGRWENNALDGIQIDDAGNRWGGIASVIPVDHVFSSNAKGGIESSFRPFHKIMGVHGVRIGKTRGEYEQPTDDMMAVNKGKADPAKCGFIPWGEVLIQKLVAGCQFLNKRARKVDGLKAEAPDVTWERDMAARGGSLPAVSEEEFWFFKPTISEVGVGTKLAGHVQVSVAPYARPFRFHVATAAFPFIERGHRVIARFDPLAPEAGCALFNNETRPMNRENWKRFQFIGIAPWSADGPQFVDCEGYRSPATAARKLRTAQVRSSFAAIESTGRAAVVHLDSDGRGNVSRVAISKLQSPLTHHDTVSRLGESAANARDTDTEPATFSTRGTAPAVSRVSFDRTAAADYIAKREAEARARGDLIET